MLRFSYIEYLSECERTGVDDPMSLEDWVDANECIEVDEAIQEDRDTIDDRIWDEDV